jgi:hypothetical protein
VQKIMGFSPIDYHFGLKPTSGINLSNGINAVAIERNPIIDSSFRFLLI